MTRKELIAYCLTYPHIIEDYPFEDKNSTIMRHKTNGKWFALIFEKEGKLCINLKCSPDDADFLRRLFQSVTPGWHMNKRHWNTVTLGGDVSEDALCKMIADSYLLTKPKTKNDRNS